MTPKAQATEENKEHWTLPKLKNLCPSKNTFKKMKRQSTECKKIFGNHISDKGLDVEYVRTFTTQ